MYYISCAYYFVLRLIQVSFRYLYWHISKIYVLRWDWYVASDTSHIVYNEAPGLGW